MTRTPGALGKRVSGDRKGTGLSLPTDAGHRTAERTPLYAPTGNVRAMSQPFEDLPTTPTAEEVVDAAYSRAARAGRAKSGREAQESMLQTATSIVADNLDHVVSSWPDFDDIDPFYRAPRRRR